MKFKDITIGASFMLANGDLDYPIEYKKISDKRARVAPWSMWIDERSSALVGVELPIHDDEEVLNPEDFVF